MSERIRVWVVEDDPVYRDTLALLLSSASATECPAVFTTCEEALEGVQALRGQLDGKEALDEGAAQNTKSAATERDVRVQEDGAVPDVILLDVNLPGMSGLEGLGRLKAALPQVCILMLTNRDDAATIYESLRTGASGYLLKSAGVDEILSAIAQAQRGGMLMPAPVAREVLAFFQARPPLPPPPASARSHGLSERELEVLSEMARGYVQKEIAVRLFLSPHTVDSHIRHIYEKLHVHSGIEAVAKAVRERLI